MRSQQPPTAATPRHGGLVLAALLALPWPAGGAPWLPAGISAERPHAGYVGPQACAECHPAHVAAQPDTAHFRASMPATVATVQGPLAPPRNRLATRDPDKDLVMREIDGALRQSLVQRGADRDVELRAGEFAVVLGAVKGQTYLYWRHDVLCQLPASYAAAADAWAYSPGYPEGVPYFDRVVQPECMECHATVFEQVLPDRVVKTDLAVLGVTCEACHGPGEAHVRHHRAQPGANVAAHITRIGELTREQQVEACGYCHSGVKADSRKQPPFSFRPGDRLVDFFEPAAADTRAVPEVHGNQLGLLQQSRCYRESDLSCTDCHDPHRDERGAMAQFAARCVACHADPGHHPTLAAGAASTDDCIGCHMPLVDSRLIDVAEGGRRHGFAVRSHRIGIYRD